MADNIAKMRAALNDGTSVTVQGISPEQLSAMQTATNYANANYPQTEKQTSILANVPSLDDISNFVQNFPVEAQRFLTNPQAFTQAITGKNPLPEETGFAASFTGLPEKNPNSLFTPEGMAYSKGYETGEPYGIAAQFTPAVGTFAKPTAKMLAEMANKQIMETGGIKLPGMPEIPVVNYAVKPRGGEWATTLGAPLEESGNLGKYLTEKTQKTPINFLYKALEPANLTNTQNLDFEKAIKQILENHGGSPNYTQDVLNSFKELTRIHNKINPDQLISLPDNINELVKAKNDWLLKNFKNYIEKEMGTGLPSDSVLAMIEKHNRPLYEPHQYSSMFGSEEARAADVRKEALMDYQFANEQFDKYGKALPNQKWQNYDLNSPQFANVGKQTAQTAPGKIYENMTDYALNRLLSFEKNALPYGSKLPNNTVVKDIRSGYTSELGFDDIIDHIIEKLISGEYKPENLKNKAISSVVSDIFENRILKEKEIGKSKQAYEDWVKTQHDQVPIESSMLGTPPAVFADGSKLALFDEVYAKNNPDMFLRQLSVDTKDLDHCVAHCGHNRANNYKRYAPAVEPHTGIMPSGGDAKIGMNYPNSVKRGQSILGSLRDPSGHAQATMEINPAFGSRDYSKFKIPQIMGLEDGPVNSQYQPYIKSWLNQQQNKIDFVGQDHGLKNISSFDLHDVGNPRIDFIGEISKQNPFFPKGMLDTLFMEVVNKENILDPGLKQAYQSGHIDPKPLFSKYLPRFFDSTDLLSFADKMGVDIMEHPSIMFKPHVENAGDMINQLENHRNFAEKIGDIAASDRFTKMIQKVTNRIVEVE
jgi:hypothetical protein